MNNHVNRLRNNEYAMKESYGLLTEVIGSMDRKRIYKSIYGGAV